MCQPNCAVTCKSDLGKTSHNSILTELRKATDRRCIGHREQTGVFFSSTLKFADAPMGAEETAKLAGDGAANAVILKKQFRAHVGFTRRAELMPSLPTASYTNSVS
jgi:hypothetical protein